MAKKSNKRAAVKSKVGYNLKSVKHKKAARPQQRKAQVHKAATRPLPVSKAAIRRSAKSPKAAVGKSANNETEVKSAEQKTKQIKDINKLLDKDYTGYEMAKSKKLKNMNIGKPEEVKNAINMLLNNEQIIDYLKKNVSRVAPEVISMLSVPRTDEYIAVQLDLKINAIRRILNILQGYGITNYYVAKNTNGWLSFAWFINIDKVEPFLEYVNRMGNGNSIINDECNDYFVCRKCYDTDKLIFTFDSAYESGFRCSCGGTLERIGKAEAEKLMRPAAEVKKNNQDYAASSGYSGE